MSIKILVISPYSRDANSFWRCMGPLSYLGKTEGIKVTLAPDLHEKAVYWDSIIGQDLIFLHRPCRPEDCNIIRLARLYNLPVWIDYDDWLFHLPTWNANKATYHNPGIQDCMAMCLATADIVTCSTQALYEKFIKVNKNTIIVPNAYNPSLYPYTRADIPRRNGIFVWRGTNTHNGDLRSVGQAFPRLPAPIHFLGSPDESVLESMDPARFKVIDPQDFMLYFKYVYQLAPKVFVFPLKDVFFNHAKSNIAFIEAIHAGAICVGPNFHEWKKPGVINYDADNHESFLKACTHAMSLPEDEFNEVYRAGLNTVNEFYNIDLATDIRKEIIKSVFSDHFQRNKRDPFDQLTAMWALSKLKETKLSVPSDQLEKRNLD